MNMHGTQFGIIVINRNKFYSLEKYIVWMAFFLFWHKKKIEVLKIFFGVNVRFQIYYFLHERQYHNLNSEHLLLRISNCFTKRGMVLSNDIISTQLMSHYCFVIFSFFVLFILSFLEQAVSLDIMCTIYDVVLSQHMICGLRVMFIQVPWLFIKNYNITQHNTHTNLITPNKAQHVTRIVKIYVIIYFKQLLKLIVYTFCFIFVICRTNCIVRYDVYDKLWYGFITIRNSRILCHVHLRVMIIYKSIILCHF